MAHNDIKNQYYRLDFSDRFMLYSDLVMVALTAAEYLRINNWEFPELDRENLRNRLMFGLTAVISAAGGCICNLEAESLLGDREREREEIRHFLRL